MTDTPPVLAHLRVRRDFLSVAKGYKQVRRGLVVQARQRDTISDNQARQRACVSDNTPPDNMIRFGLTATRKIGNAVIRNRVRRRFRALANEVLVQYGRGGFDYVLIGRVHSATRKWHALRADLRAALKAIHKGHDAG